MKELSIEEKAKAYDKALEVAKRKLCFDKAGLEDSYTPNDLYEIFPELKESEDERIRKELIEHIKANKEVDYVLFKKFSPDEVIAWLEKQGQVKESAISQHENLTCKENDDSLTSEDERIRKTIYNCVKWFGFDSRFFKDFSQEECLAWLEKQGEQRFTWSEEQIKVCQKVYADILSAKGFDLATINSEQKRLKKQFKSAIAWLKKQGNKPQGKSALKKQNEL